MKKVLTFVAICIAVLAGNVAKAQLGINAGYLSNVTTAETSLFNVTTQTDVNWNGFYVGGDYNINLVKGLGLDLGLNIEYKNANEKQDAYEATSTTIDLFVPVLLNYTLDLAVCKLSAFAGPTFRYGLAYNSETNTAGLVTKTNAYGYDDSDLNAKRFQLGLSLGVAAQISHIRVNVGYNFGFSNTAPEKVRDNLTVTNNTLFAGVGYVF